MKLTDLRPAWFAAPGRSGMGVVFDCPCCVGKPSRTALGKPSAVRLGIPFALPLDGGPAFAMAQKLSVQCVLWGALGGEAVEESDPDPVRFYPPPNTVVGGVLWGRTGDNFETLTLSPSVDASPAGHWHGWLQNGEAR